jgi:hypothetical protein
VSCLCWAGQQRGPCLVLSTEMHRPVVDPFIPAPPVLAVSPYPTSTSASCSPLFWFFVLLPTFVWKHWRRRRRSVVTKMPSLFRVSIRICIRISNRICIRTAIAIFAPTGCSRLVRAEICAPTGCSREEMYSSWREFIIGMAVGLETCKCRLTKGSADYIITKN